MSKEIQVSRPTLVTGPASEPITLAEARKQCELGNSTAHDDHLLLLIQAAREQWEHDTDAACITQTWSVTTEDLCDDEIYLPKRPLQSVTHVKYYDETETLQTLSTSVYDVDVADRAVRLGYMQNWPLTIDTWNAVTVTYVVGYTSATLVPAIQKQAMRLLIGYYFENRDMLTNDIVYKSAAYENLVARFMRSTYP